MQSVISSNLAAAGWENNVLRIAFLQGGIYDYYEVPKRIYEALLLAGCKGRYFIYNIKNHYHCNIVG